MKYLLKNTKIVSTFGPAITREFNENLDAPTPALRERLDMVHDTIRELIFEGINCVRCNFSHGSLDERNVRSELVRNVQLSLLDSQSGAPQKFLRPILFMADTKGPEIRVFKMPPDGVLYEKGTRITISCIDKVPGTTGGFSVLDSTGSYNMANDCVVGNIVLVEDGKLSLEILGVDKPKGLVTALVRNTHTLKSNKRINLPGADYSMDFVSQKDVDDVRFAVDNGYEYIALSFVNTRRNIEDIKAIIESRCREKGISFRPKIISKIETMKSCENIDEIIDASDSIMIARGDLGLEIPYYQVPYWTKVIIKRCRDKGKSVIVATQMLDSLEKNVTATRAEVSDVYRAAEMGSDCTMLSGETAQGQFPVIAVNTMCNIVYESEKYFNSDKFLSKFRELNLPHLLPAHAAVCTSLAQALRDNPGVGAIVGLSGDFPAGLLMAISGMKLPVPLWNFIQVDSAHNYVNNLDLSTPKTAELLDSLSLNLYRSINPVIFDGEGAEAHVLFSRFLANQESLAGGKAGIRSVLCMEGGSWKLRDV